MRFLNHVLAWFPAKMTFNKDIFLKILSTSAESLVSPGAKHSCFCCFKSLFFLDQVDWLASFPCEFLNFSSPDQ